MAKNTKVIAEVAKFSEKSRIFRRFFDAFSTLLRHFDRYNQHKGNGTIPAKPIYLGGTETL